MNLKVRTQLLLPITNEHADVPSRYQVIKRLGEGSFGFVVAAKDKQTGKRIAIKKIKDAFNDEQDGVR